MKHPARRIFLCASLACIAGGIMNAHAEEWPRQPIRLLISQAPGATPDILARLLGERLGKTLGQAVIVENRPGGGNIIGAQMAAKSAPDGYTFFLATAAALVANPYTFKTLPYDPMKDFVPVGMVGGNYFVVAVNNDVPAKNLPELLALAKAQPDKFAFSSDGTKGFAGILGEWINVRGGTKMLQVPFTSSSQSLQEAIAGRVQVTIQATPTIMPFIARGAVRPLAISGSIKSKGFENIPAVASTLPGVELYGWLAVVAPKGVPAPVVEKFNRAMNSALQDPAFRQRIQELGIVTEGAGTPAALGKFLQDEYTRWGQITKEIGIVAD